jgi:DNA-directed RNA polymerase specialized sigma24 family protein
MDKNQTGAAVPLKRRIAESRDRLYRVALTWCGDEMLADDLVQETMASDIVKRRQLRDEKRLFAWLYSILNNNWRRHLRWRWGSLPVRWASTTAGTWIVASSQQQHSDHIVLHISEANPLRFAAALGYADKFPQRHPAPDSRVEVIANAGGLDMMRTGLSPYEDQIGALLEAHPNVRFLACANAVAKLRKQSIEPHLMDNVDTEKKAIDHIVARLQEGWSYVRVDALPEI